jgi:hypothetical protein
MEANLIENKTSEMIELEEKCNMFLEDYFESLMSGPKVRPTSEE